jgi:oligopeptide/dipeptide ABC transporter ATP-binding protein
MVLEQGAVVEEGTCSRVFANPQRPYTQALLSAIPLPDPDSHWIDRDVRTEARP